MPTPVLSIAIVDQLSTIQALVTCATMACDAIDDQTQSDALQTLLTRVDDLLRDVAQQTEAGVRAMAAA